MNEQVLGWEQTYNERIRAAYRLVARHVYGHFDLGDFAYTAFDHINSTFWGGTLPEPLLLWDITAYGGCLGWTRSTCDGPPIIKLHPSTVAPSASSTTNPWRIPPEILGFCYAYYTLVHETIHVAVNYLHGGYESLPDYKRSWTSHNNPLWIAEVNRIAALMGLPANYQMKKYRRVPTGEVNDKGQPVTKVQYGYDGPDFERFPHDTPGAQDFYLKGILPFPWQRNPSHAAKHTASQ
jgi:hypothetical protein